VLTVDERISWRKPLAILAALALVAFLGKTLLMSSDDRTVTAYFTSAASLYEGNPVEVLGVPVGSVASVEPESGRVKVVLHLDEGVKLPADVHALQVAPSLISGRSIALAPAYDGGDQLRDGAVIPVERTEVPLDVNDLFRSADSLATALGPQGTNKDGALSRFLEVLAANLDGNGKSMAAALHDLGAATTTLAGSREDLTGTIRGLQQFVSTLAAHDDSVRSLNVKLASVSGTLSDERFNLSAALNQLAATLGTVADFVEDNRSAIRSNVDRLSKVSRVLVKERALLGQIMDEAPTGLTNLLNSYNAAGGTLDARLNVNELSAAPGALLCMMAARGTPGGLPKALLEACNKFSAALDSGTTLPTISDILATLQGNKAPALPSTQGSAR
jgi:virulence factor Mce-like protein